MCVCGNDGWMDGRRDGRTDGGALLVVSQTGHLSLRLCGDVGTAAFKVQFTRDSQTGTAQVD